MGAVCVSRTWATVGYQTAILLVTAVASGPAEVQGFHRDANLVALGPSPRIVDARLPANLVVPDRLRPLVTTMWRNLSLSVGSVHGLARTPPSWSTSSSSHELDMDARALVWSVTTEACTRLCRSAAGTPDVCRAHRSRTGARPGVCGRDRRLSVARQGLDGVME